LRATARESARFGEARYLLAAVQGIPGNIQRTISLGDRAWAKRAASPKDKTAQKSLEPSAPPQRYNNQNAPGNGRWPAERAQRRRPDSGIQTRRSICVRGDL